MVLFVKSLFPLNNPPAVRTISLVKYLIRYGWTVHLFVWTSDPVDYVEYPFLRDINLTVLDIRPRRGIGRYFYHIIKTLRIMERSLRKIEGKFVFFASVPQMQALLLGALLKKRLNMTLVEELRDVYSINKTKKRKLLNRKAVYLIEKAAMRNVDCFIFVTPIIKEEYLRCFSAVNSRLSSGAVIYNSIDEEEWDDIVQDKNVPRKRLEILFTYVGNLYGSRNLDSFLEALGILKGQGDVGPVRIRIIGRISPGNKAILDSVVRRYDLEAEVDWVGPLAHRDALKEIAQADFNLLVTHREGSEYAIPSKLFEYMFVRRPIFAITHDPLVIKIMDEYRLGIHSDFAIESIRDALRRAVQERDKIESQIGPFPSSFTRAFTTRQISDFVRGQL